MDKLLSLSLYYSELKELFRYAYVEGYKPWNSVPRALICLAYLPRSSGRKLALALNLVPRFCSNLLSTIPSKNHILPLPPSKMAYVEIAAAPVDACYLVKCDQCDKTTWKGCGQHADAVSGPRPLS
ncbi:hypothetical protein C8Q78DRAFT_799014 [Trametes maxima]|nr:hypothetical protein C8Q78DRAFT_799014 [Trametes maxima]